MQSMEKEHRDVLTMVCLLASLVMLLKSYIMAATRMEDDSYVSTLYNHLVRRDQTGICSIRIYLSFTHLPDRRFVRSYIGVSTQPRSPSDKWIGQSHHP